MKFLALEREIVREQPADFAPHLDAETRRVWELTQTGILREIYFRGDRTEAVLILECVHLDEAHEAIASLPLVQAGLIEFELIPLIPYPGYARLFREDDS